MDAFLPFLHSDLMLLTGFIEPLDRLLLPSSVESSEKRLDGAGNAASVWLTMLPFRLSTSREACRSLGVSNVEDVVFSGGSGTSCDAMESDAKSDEEQDEGYRPKGSGDKGITGELDNAAPRKDGGIISEYVGPWPLCSSLLALDPSDSVSIDMENDFLYGDTGMAFGTPFRANLGGDGGGREERSSMLRDGDVSPSPSCRRIEEYGTAGDTTLGLLGNLYALGL
jgi:hypothetical protein